MIGGKKAGWAKVLSRQNSSLQLLAEIADELVVAVLGQAVLKTEER
jgi:hypothetical protein